MRTKARAEHRPPAARKGKMTMRYDAAIFDLDGTLLDTIDDLKNSINHALSVCGYPPRTRAEVLAFVGNGVPRLVELAVPPGTPADRRQAVLDAMNAHYAAHCAELTRPYPGITGVLRTLRAAGVRVAVVSNKPDYGVQASQGKAVRSASRSRSIASCARASRPRSRTRRSTSRACSSIRAATICRASAAINTIKSWACPIAWRAAGSAARSSTRTRARSWASRAR